MQCVVNIRNNNRKNRINHTLRMQLIVEYPKILSISPRKVLKKKHARDYPLCKKIKFISHLKQREEAAGQSPWSTTISQRATKMVLSGGASSSLGLPQKVSPCSSAQTARTGGRLQASCWGCETPPSRGCCIALPESRPLRKPHGSPIVGATYCHGQLSRRATTVGYAAGRRRVVALDRRHDVSPPPPPRSQTPSPTSNLAAAAEREVSSS